MKAGKHEETSRHAGRQAHLCSSERVDASRNAFWCCSCSIPRRHRSQLTVQTWTGVCVVCRVGGYRRRV